MSERVKVAYYSDVLCVWAYVAQIKVDEMRDQLGDKVDVDCHFIPVFGDTAEKIGRGWKDRGGFAGYGRHVLETAQRFPHVQVHSDIWTKDIPPSSAGCHLALKAVQQLCDQELAAPGSLGQYGGRALVEEYAWRLREAFFVRLTNVAERAVHLELAESLDIPIEALQRAIDDGSAFAALCGDWELQKRHSVQGSPTWVLNEGRQKLYGNVGYRIIEANLKELLAGAPADSASWC
jgi:predicted DsbA family dithiol-disulfide isomerase